MKNPLNKRLPRELVGEMGKYAVIFILLIASIGFVSGFLVADGSMIIAYNESFEKYNVEDGNFRTASELTNTQERKIQEKGVTLYPNFYMDLEVSGGSTLRVFKNRSEANLVCLMQGEMPGSRDEIAIDRMYADNNGLQVGDGITVAGRSLKISGLVALPDYSALFSDNNDTMFDAVKFGVSVVTEESFAAFDDSHIQYCYSWKYQDAPKDTIDEKEKAEELMKDIAGIAALEDFIPAFLNQAIQFTGEDMGSDRAMMIVLLYIIIVILAFVFGITISNTISREATVIGTLRASGYTKGELIRHYMAVPLLVTLIGAVLGNILGYTWLRVVCADMYYGSYSLPTYHTVWNGEAFLETTVVPLILMFFITLAVLCNKLSLPPLKFIRRDLKKKSRRKALRLNKSIGFLSRFRIRIILQNLSNYITLFVGIILANLLLMFGLLFPALLDNFQEEITSNLISNYQYVLEAPVSILGSTNPLTTVLSALQLKMGIQTGNEDAERYGMYALETIPGRIAKEQISIYGVKKDSRYVELDLEGDGVYISDGYANKYGIKAGDTITLKEKYEDKEYELQVAGVYDYPAALAVFMELESFNDTFGYERGNFSGYFSDSEITDIDDKYIASVIDLEALTKVSRQLQVSMGNMMYLVDGFAILIFVVLIYLLSKIIIEKNEQSISMIKILGYSDGEISRLYIMSTSIVVILCLLLSLPLEGVIMEKLFTEMVAAMMSGWITYYVPPVIYGKMFLLGLVTYLAVAALEYRKIRRVPMSEALKNVE